MQSKYLIYAIPIESESETCFGPVLTLFDDEDGMYAVSPLECTPVAQK